VKVHAIQTGWVKIKTAQPEGHGRGIFRQLAIFADPNWTDWAPTYAWLIDHKEGPIVVDTGQGVHLLEHGRSLHPYVRWEVAFRIEPEEEIGLRLKALGLGPRDIKRVILTHLHMDHDGGLRHFQNSEILVAPNELALARGFMGAMRGYLPNRWPSWFDPVPLDLVAESVDGFAASRRITKAGDIVVVATPGHTANHVSVLAFEDDAAVLIAGDASYTQDLMLGGKVDGVSPDVATAGATLAAIQKFALKRPTIYLPTHDSDAGIRLAERKVVPRGDQKAAI
jgi:N-acyl homoserine lactone hydrolase